MRSSIPKVLHQIGGKSMLQHVIETAQKLDPVKIHIVTGYGSDEVREKTTKSVGDLSKNIRWSFQEEQLGTGHAVAQALPGVSNDATCLILYGDSPLVDAETLAGLCRSTASLSLITTKPECTDGLGRIIRDTQDRIRGIVEEKDATAEQKLIPEINTGIMACKADLLDRWLSGLNNHNNQGEYYLTDIVAAAVSDKESVHTETATEPERMMGVNSCAELALAERVYQKIVAQRLMREGLTIRDPARLDVRGDVLFGPDCVVDVNVILEGNINVGKNVVIGPNCVIRDSVIGDHCQVHANSVLDNATLGEACEVGPFARIRPETTLADQVKIGNFVEVKKSSLGVGSKANHLAYVGDSSIGHDVNIGAGVITCNYDGANKSQTVIGDHVFVGSDVQLIAPVEIGDGATIGAGSTITRNVEPGKLALSRPKQKTIDNWRRPLKK